MFLTDDCQHSYSMNQNKMSIDYSWWQRRYDCVERYVRTDNQQLLSALSKVVWDLIADAYVYTLSYRGAFRHTLLLVEEASFDAVLGALRQEEEQKARKCAVDPSTPASAEQPADKYKSSAR